MVLWLHSLYSVAMFVCLTVLNVYSLLNVVRSLLNICNFRMSA